LHWIDLAVRVSTILSVAAPVVQHVSKCVAHLARTSEQALVIAVVEDLAAAAATGWIRERSVDVLRGRDRESLHAISEGRFAVGLDD
jgi:hypothetical protein